MCTGGYELMIPSINHYKAVEEIIKQKNLEHYTRDNIAEMPLKVAIRGLPDMKTSRRLVSSRS